MADFLTLDDLNVSGQRVLVRADLNVPFENGHVTDATRIVRFAPTALELASKGAKVIILSHFGRPKEAEPEFSLKQLQSALEKALGKKVQFADDCLTADTNSLKNGEIMLCEKDRFH
jgi:phosphoglycerate kinase